MSNQFPSISEAVKEAKAQSKQQGFAWIVPTIPPIFVARKRAWYQVVSGISDEDAPVQFNAEYRNGVEVH